MNINLEQALELIAAAKEKATDIGVPMVVAVVDAGGNLVALQRMDQALLVSIDIATNKAYTAVAIKIPTHELAKLSQSGQPLFGIHTTDGGRIVIFGGGFPLKKGDELYEQKKYEEAASLLENHLDRAPVGSSILALQASDGPAPEADLAGSWQREPEKQASQRGLAAPGLADDGGRGPRHDLQRDVVDGRDVRVPHERRARAVDLRCPSQFEDRCLGVLRRAHDTSTKWHAASW